jgi:hypothetical protein
MEKEKESQKYLNEVLTLDVLIEIFSYLHGGMILRCGAVCQNWKEACDDDYLWLMILGTEYEFAEGLNFEENVKLNKKFARKWRKKNGTSAKHMYVTKRRADFYQKKLSSTLTREQLQRMKVFPLYTINGVPRDWLQT